MKSPYLKIIVGMAFGAVLLCLGCTGSLANRGEQTPGAGKAAQSQSQAQPLSAGSAAAFLAFESPYDYQNCLGIKDLSDQYIDVQPHQQSDERWEQASKSGSYIVQIGGRGPEGIVYRIGWFNDRKQVEWKYRGQVTTIPVYADDYDVAVNEFNHVVFVWSSNNWANAYYSSAVINPDSGTGLNWNQNNIQFTAAGGLFHNMRIAFGGTNADVLGIVYKPSDPLKRYYGSGEYNLRDGSINWRLQTPPALTGRSSGDGIYDIAMDMNGGFSLAWATNQGSRHYAYHLQGVCIGSSVYANGLMSQVCSAKDSLTTKYAYYDVEVGRSTDGGDVIITIPQGCGPFDKSLGTISAKCDSKGNLRDIRTDGKNLGTAADGSFWANDTNRGWAHLAY